MFTINDIQKANRDNGGHWFDPDSLRFFRSRIGSDVFQGPGGIYFVSSERYSDEAARLYSVRTFDPATGNIGTAGEFQQYRSGSTARRAARKLAGNGSASVRSEPHRPLTDLQVFIADIQAEAPNVELATITKLIRLARRHHRLAELCCGDGSINQAQKAKAAEVEIEKVRERLEHVIQYFGKGWGVRCSGDPRGCTVKLVMPSGRTNDWGKEGYCVPMD